MDNQGEHVARLRRLIESQRGLCGMLDALSFKQHELLASGDAEAVLGVLDERGRVLDRLVAQAEELESLVRGGALRGETLDEAVREIEAVAKVAQSVSARDEADSASLAALRERASEELSKLRDSSRAASAYSGGGGRGPVVEDRRG